MPVLTVKSRRWLLAAVLPLVLAACTSTAGQPGSGTGTTAAASGSAAPGGRPGLAAVRHVWVIELDNQGYAQRFGSPSADPYLATTLPRMGALLENYYAIGHSSADNYIAEISGQAPDLATHPERLPSLGALRRPGHRRAVSSGRRRGVRLPGGGPDARQPAVRRRAQLGRVPARHGQRPGPGPHRQHGPRARLRPPHHLGHRPRPARRNRRPVCRAPRRVHVLLVGHREPAFCDAHILSFRPLPRDLARAAVTPAFSFIEPNLCDDGHDSPCVTGAPGGLAQADVFLAQWVLAIMAAPAYRDGGLIVVTFDEGSDAAACCGETFGISPSHPNVPLPGKTGPGDGRIGAVLLSPLIRPGTVSTVDYNHYSLLRSIEDIFGLPHLGDAAMPQVRSFGHQDVFGSTGPGPDRYAPGTASP